MLTNKLFLHIILLLSCAPIQNSYAASSSDMSLPGSSTGSSDLSFRDDMNPHSFVEDGGLVDPTGLRRQHAVMQRGSSIGQNDDSLYLQSLLSMHQIALPDMGIATQRIEQLTAEHSGLAGILDRFKNPAKYLRIKYPTQAAHLLKWLGQRNVYVMHMCDTLGVEKFSDVAEQVTYSLISVKNDREGVNILSQVSFDSPNVDTRNAYEIFYDQITHLPRVYRYDRELTNSIIELQLPHTLGTQEFIPERICYTHVMLQPITSDLQREQVQQYLDILKQACASGEHQEAFRAFSHIVGQTYLHPEMQANEHMRQQNIALFNTVIEAINAGDIITAANNMSMLQHELQSIGKNVIFIPERVNAFIQQHATLTVAEKQESSSILLPSSSDISSQHTAIDYACLRDQVRAEHAAIFQKIGKKSEYHLSRENALAVMVQGDHAVCTKGYSLHQKAFQKFEKAGIDTRRFTECTGNLIQQDTHAKFVNIVNSLADYRPTTTHGKHIKTGTIDCAQAGAQLNKEGHIREAMYIADFCQAACDFSRGIYDGVCTGAAAWWHRDEAREHTLTAGSSSSHVAAEVSAECTYCILEAAEIIARSAKGFAVGSYEGAQQIAPLELVQNLANIVEYIAGKTCEFVQNGAHIEDCLLRGDREGAERYYQANNALVSSAGQALQNVADTLLLIDEHKNSTVHAPQTPVEWESAARSVGACATRNIGEAYVTGQFLRGASKVAQGISQNIRGFDQVTRELALSVQLTCMPATELQIMGCLHPIENVRTHIGSRHISGIPAVHPEFGSHVIINTGEQLLESVTQVIADTSSGIASRTASALQLGKQLGSTLTEAKPGFIQLPGSSNNPPAEVLADIKTIMRIEVEQYGAVTLETAQKVWNNSPEFHSLNARVVELSKTVPDTKVGKVLSDDVSLYKKFKTDDASHAYYEQIRSKNDDIAIISHNTGIDKDIIEKIKNHVFNETHILDGRSVERFAPCEDAVEAWKRLISNNFIQSDLRLLQHELAESLLMNGQEMSWEATHHTVNKIYNWIDNI